MNCQFENLPFNVRNDTEKKVDNKTRQEDKHASAEHGDKIMNLAELIKALQNLGVKIANDATIEQAMAAFAKLKVEDKKADPAPADDEQAKTILTLQNAVTALTNSANAKRQGEVDTAVQNAIDTDRIPANQKESWVKMAMADSTGTVLANLANLPSKPPGVPPIDIEVTDVAPKDIGAGLAKFNEPMKSWQRGNSVKMETIRDASVNRGVFINKHLKNLIGVWNTNTIDTALKRDVILQAVIKDFARKLLPLSAFSTVFSNVPLEGTNKVQVPFYDLDTTASRSFANGTGYTLVGNTAIDNREITVGQGATDGDRLFQDMSFTSEEIARQPYLKIVELAGLKADKLASDIFTDVLGIVTLANFGAAAVVSSAGAFDSVEMANLKLACKLWPDMGRSVILDSDYDAALMKDSVFVTNLNAGDGVIREGKIGKRAYGFDYYDIPTIPPNGENLVGFAVFQSAILVATAPVPPVQEVRNSGTSYSLVVDPQTGIAFEYRTFGNNTLDTAVHIIECNYGFAKGNGNALKRVTSA